MKKLLYIALIFLVYSCKEDSSKKFVVVTYNHGNVNSENAFKEGDTLDLQQTNVVLEKGQKLLLNDIAGGMMFQILGPLQLKDFSISSSQVKSFNEKYVSLIKENLKSSEPVLRQRVFGGTSRAGELAINWMNLESICSSEIQIKIREKAKESCVIKMFVDDELIHETLDRDFIYDVSKWRNIREDRILTVRYVCNKKHKSVELNLISQENLEQLQKEQIALLDLELPDIVLLNFYLENKMFENAWTLLTQMSNASNDIKSYYSILANYKR